jgi:hypothetical protein
MNPIFKSALTAAIAMAALPVQAAPNANVWNTNAAPAMPYRYIESAPIMRLTPQNANLEIYASEALLMRLYPSINTGALPVDATNAASITSKTRDLGQNQPRGILSSSYVQEFAYIDTYSNTREFEEFFNIPSISMSLAMPRIGNGFGGGYQPLQIGLGPAAFRFW